MWFELEKQTCEITAISQWVTLDSWSAQRLPWTQLEHVEAGITTVASWVMIETATGGGTAPLPPPPPPAIVPPPIIPLPGAWNSLETWRGRETGIACWFKLDISTCKTLPIVLVISPEKVSVEQGGSARVIIKVEGEFSGMVRLEVEQISGIITFLSQTEGKPVFLSELKIEVTPFVHTGTYMLHVWASAGDSKAEGGFAIEVKPPTRLSSPVVAGSVAVFNFSDLKAPIEKAEVQAIENVVEPYLIIEFLKQLPAGLPAPELPVYIYAKVKTNVPNRSVKFRFTVEESWLKSQRVSTELVCMLKLGVKWQKFVARYIGSAENKRIYEIEIPLVSEVSMLAIAGESKAVVPLAVLLFGLVSGIGIGGWLLVRWLLRPKPYREVLEKVKKTVWTKSWRRATLERYQEAVVYQKRPKLRTASNRRETKKIEELQERLRRRVKEG
jgi:PGF-pre-PGF domain-containing protein